MRGVVHSWAGSVGRNILLEEVRLIGFRDIAISDLTLFLGQL